MALDQGILSIVEGSQVTLLRDLVQSKLSHLANMNAEQIQLVNQEVRRMFQKEAIQDVFHFPMGFMSNIFLVDKKDERETGHKSEESKYLFPIKTLQDGRLTQLLIDILQEINFMCKINLTDVYFSVPINKTQKSTSVLCGIATYSSFFAFVLTLILLL